ncbi:MAG: beta-ketoacyl-[acyl-carrier-protein] synthase family protein [Desulfovibrio sp.]|nr:beta-ketoacyl-[acyl-carrier-protein] synthase family protein [Desulfovibrio sp.]
MREAVITGVGAVSVLGLSREDIAANLYNGKCGLVADASRLGVGFRSPLTGVIHDFDGSQWLSRKQRKTMPTYAQHAYVAARQAMDQACLDNRLVHDPRCGLIFGNDSNIGPAFTLAALRREQQPTSTLGSGHMFQIMNSTISMNLDVLLGITGGSWTVSAACASGLLALGQAVDNIRLGRQDIVICGAAQELFAEAVSAFDGLGAFSLCPDPQRASRPFDAARDGLVPSGGAAALVLEEEQHAQTRGARVLGRIRGWGYSSDGQNLIVPSSHGLSRAMRLALADAHVRPEDITEINAHATSTPVGDAAEALNICDVFGDACPTVLTIKALTGHEFWMAGAAQIVYAVIMAEYGFRAGSPSYEHGDAQTAAIPVLRLSDNTPPSLMLCNAAGFGGINVSMVVQFP